MRGPSAIERVLADLSKRAVDLPALDYYPRLRRLHAYVDEHLADPIHLSDAARVANLEPRYLSAYFRKKVGVTFTQWLRLRRVRAAAIAIVRTDASITQIGFRVGFGDVRTFERAFKHETGVTPRQFKQLVETTLVASANSQ